MTETSVQLAGALEAAARDVRDAWKDVLPHAGSPDEIGTTVDRLVAAVAAQNRDGTLEALAGTPLTRRLLAALRRRFVVRVAELATGVDPEDLIAALQTMEDVAAAIEPTWDRQFTDQLAGPDGLELVVEVAHDLRSPLTSILFLAETLQKGRSGMVTPLQERQLGLIYSAAFGLSAVASDVIELARGGDRLVDLDPLPFSVGDILESVRDIVLPIAEEKGLGVKLLAPTRSFRVGHPVAINRVLLNLTTNALKFTDEGSVEMSAVEREGTQIEFAVRDTGRGIPSANMAMLFEPFRRRQRDRDYAFSGSGLGLSICRKLVEAMGSELHVDTSEGEGTRFSFTLDLPLTGVGDTGP